MKYLVALHTDDGKCFGVSVPDLKGCYSAGYSIPDALASVKEAIESHTWILRECGEVLPEPLSISEHMANPEYADCLWAFVEAEEEDYFS